MVVFVYQGYRDTIDTFHGKFDTLEAAENHIYQDLVKEVQEFLDTMEQKKNGTYVSEQTKTLKQAKDPIIERMGNEYYEKSLNDYEKRDAEITEHALESLKYYENTDWKGEFKKVSQTPMPSIQQSSKKMYEGYSQRYAESQGNYPYIVFDPSFVPPSKEMNAEYTLLDGIREEFKDAEQPIRMSQEDLLEFFNSLKTNEEILVWYNSGIRSADDWTEMTVGRRSESKKYGVKKVALKGTGGGKFYLYNRKGRISLAMGDMATVLIAAKKRDIRKAESFDVEFNEWADQELMSHGKDISFKDWAEDEGMKHGDVPITDWAQHEEESHDERYGAEDNTESIKSAIKKLEKALSKTDGAKYKMHDLDISAQPTTIAGFEMSRNGEKYDGGSYLIMTDGSIVNAAMGNAEYGNITDSIEGMNEKIMQSFGAEGILCSNCLKQMREISPVSDPYDPEPTYIKPMYYCLHCGGNEGRMTTAQVQYDMKDMKELNPNWKEVFPIEHYRAETFEAQQLEHNYKSKSFFAESEGKHDWEEIFADENAYYLNKSNWRDGRHWKCVKCGEIKHTKKGMPNKKGCEGFYEDEEIEFIAETFGADEGIVEKYKHGIEIREFPNSSSVYQKGRLVKQYRGDGHLIRATSKAQQLEWDYKPKSFFSESKSKKTKYGMIAAGVITAFALLPEIKKRF